MHIDPWGSTAYQDYARLRDAFGIAEFGPESWQVFRDPHLLLRRGIVFGHRDFERIADAVRGRDPWTVMTGFMPSGDLHLGHKMVLEQVVAHTGQGADAVLALADFEAMAARGFSLEKAHRIARDQYVHNALALGLDPGRGRFYYQTRRGAVKDLAHQFARKVNLSTLQALYGFGGETSLAHLLAPLVQAADILHVQLDADGPRPVLVPVGVDQDPHIRLTRDVAQDWRQYSVQATEEGLSVFVRGEDEPAQVKRRLDEAERVLRDLGYGEFRRNDGYKAIHVRGARGGDMRRIDAALARAEARAGPGPALLRPSATFHRFMTGLQGGKMSSSKPETSVYLTEDPASARKKVMASVTGGRATAEEQRRLGADPHKCPVYELYLYHLAKDDAHLQQVHDECSTGARLCGGCKKEAVEHLVAWLVQHKEKRDQVAHMVDEAIAPA
ncbi:MAG TPA: tryptophan--tRNA ligase [Candidatus Thermoplasmatota archaeon]|nr:tryptophan--tRNA ligase [Candidatus Thermoplasmatota archaeon]